MRIASMLVALAAVACGDTSEEPPAQVAGEYNLSVTNRENGCGFENWNEGATTSSIPLTVTQSEHSVTAVLGGLAGVFANLVLGSDTFTGEIVSNTLALTLFGSRSATEADCTWTVNANLDATLTGDALAGTIEYVTATNGSPDCGTREGCHSEQAFNGTRPPTP